MMIFKLLFSVSWSTLLFYERIGVDGVYFYVRLLIKLMHIYCLGIRVHTKLNYFSIHFSTKSKNVWLYWLCMCNQVQYQRFDLFNIKNHHYLHRNKSIFENVIFYKLHSSKLHIILRTTLTLFHKNAM